MELAAIFTATPAGIDVQIAKVTNQKEALHQLQLRADLVINSKNFSQAEKHAALHNSDVAFAKIGVLDHLLVALASEYHRRGGWARVYAVNNSNGHFHRTQACSTTYVTTPWVWMPELSGLTDAEVVAKTGKMSCLVCFGSERETIELGREATIFTPAQQKTRDEQAAAAAKKAEKAKKAAENSITNPDGTPLRNDGEVIKTVRTAWIEAVDELVWADYSEDGIATADAVALGDKLASHVISNLRLIREHYENTFRIAQAIAHKENRPLADVMTEVLAKADKKIQEGQPQDPALIPSGGGPSGPPLRSTRRSRP